MSPRSIMLLSPFVSSESGEKYEQIKQCLQVKTVQNSSKKMSMCFDVRGQQGMDFFSLEEVGYRLLLVFCPEEMV